MAPPPPRRRPPAAALAGRLWKRRYVVPTEHGSWALWLGPFVIGLALGGSLGGGVAALFTGALAGFLLHQPAQVAVKALSERGPRSDLLPALVWAGALSVVAALAVPCLLAHHHPRVLLFVAPGVLLFAWHLVLVARKDERRQRGMLLILSAALALAAPAAYVVAHGADLRTPWVLAVLCWLHSATNIATVYVRFEQRRVPARGPGAPPASTVPDAQGTAPARQMLAWHLLALAAAGASALLGLAPPLVPLAFLLPAADALRIAGPGARPPPHALTPRRIGLHQLAVDAAFTALFVLLWR